MIDPQLPLFPKTTRARARKTDPATSHEAAGRVRNVTDTQWRILSCLKHSPKTDPELYAVYNRSFPSISESGCRSRRAELVALGYVAGLETKTHVGNRRFLIWSLTGKGLAAYGEAQASP